MLGDRARTALAGTRFADLRWVEETGSTNADLLAAALDGTGSDGTVLLAEHQTAGRGRLGRTWEAPPGASLLCSTLIRPDLPLDRVHLVTMAVGVAAADACASVAGVHARLKWPNDLVLAMPTADGGPGTDRKVAGILAESHVREGAVVDLVVGMGLNVNWPAALPDDLAAIATALNHHAGRDIDREDLIAAHLQGLEAVLAGLDTTAGRESLLARYGERSATLGRRVRVETGSGFLVGTATDVTEDGHLLLDVHGEVVTVSAGDVVHLRPQD